MLSRSLRQRDSANPGSPAAKAQRRLPSLSAKTSAWILPEPDRAGRGETAIPRSHPDAAQREESRLDNPDSYRLPGLEPRALKLTFTDALMIVKPSRIRQ